MQINEGKKLVALISFQNKRAQPRGGSGSQHVNLTQPYKLIAVHWQRVSTSHGQHVKRVLLTLLLSAVLTHSGVVASRLKHLQCMEYMWKCCINPKPPTHPCLHLTGRGFLLLTVDYILTFKDGVSEVIRSTMFSGLPICPNGLTWPVSNAGWLKGEPEQEGEWSVLTTSCVL